MCKFPEHLLKHYIDDIDPEYEFREIDNELLEDAIILAARFHGSQLDKANNLYILHPLHVMLQMKTIEEKIVAVMHDTIEDTGLTISILKGMGWPKLIIDAIDAISKREGETNKEYWTRVKANPLATRVKLKDMEHNSSPERISCLPYGEQEYLTNKYVEMREFFKV